MVHSASVEHDIKFRFEIDDYRTILVDFFHDVSLSGFAVSTSDEVVVLHTVGRLSIGLGFPLLALLRVACVGVMVFWHQEILCAKLLDQKGVTTITPLVIVVAVDRLLWRQGHIMSFDAQTSTQHRHRRDCVTGTTILLLWHRAQVPNLLIYWLYFFQLNSFGKSDTSSIEKLRYGSFSLSAWFEIYSFSSIKAYLNWRLLPALRLIWLYVRPSHWVWTFAYQELPN